MFIGGLASLLLQSLHPAAMAGVADHSGYRGDPWGRLQRTSRYIATTSFATIDQAEQMINAVRGIHEHITGTRDGISYAASDPHLLTWVHVAETYCFLTAHDEYGHVRLSPQERDTYVAQAGYSASLLGAEHVPSTAYELDEMLSAFRPELRPTSACLDARDFLIKDPPIPRLARPGYMFLIRGAVDILPEWARQELGLRLHPFDRLVGNVGTSVIRWAMSADVS